MRILALAVLWLVMNLAVALGCGGPAQWRYEEALQQTAEPAAHGVHDERLTIVMRDLERLRDERLPKAFDMREEQDRRAREVARVAQAMAESAARIPAALPPDLDAQGQADFRALAAELERMCAQLAEEAPRLTAKQRRSRLTQIDATCNQCHGGFRIPGVVHDQR
jgi:cytochrome c556